MTSQYDPLKGGFTGDASKGLTDYTIAEQQRAGVGSFDTPDMANQKMHHKKMMDIRGGKYSGSYAENSGPLVPSFISNFFKSIFGFFFVTLPKHHLLKFIAILICLVGLFFIHNASTAKWSREAQYALLPSDFKFMSADFWGVSDKDNLSNFRKMPDSKLHQMYVGNVSFDEYQSMNIGKHESFFQRLPSQFNKLKSNQKLAYMQAVKERLFEIQKNVNTPSNLNATEHRAFVWNSCILLKGKFYNSERFSPSDLVKVKSVIGREAAALEFTKGCYSENGPAESLLQALYFDRKEGVNAQYYEEVNSANVMWWRNNAGNFNDLLLLIIFVLLTWAFFTTPKISNSAPPPFS